MQIRHLLSPFRLATLKSPTKWIKSVLGVSSAALIFAASAISSRATETVPLGLDRIVHDSGPIFVGTVSSAQTVWGNDAHTWMKTIYTVHADNVVSTDSTVSQGSDINFSFWGGTIGSQTQIIADVVYPKIGSKYVFLLRKDWQTPGFTPSVGLEDGILTLKPSGTGAELATDIDGADLGQLASGKIVRGFEVKRGEKNQQGVTLNALLAYIKSNLNSIKAETFAADPKPAPNDPRVLKTYGKSPAGVGDPDAALRVQGVAPIQYKQNIATPTKPKNINEVVRLNAQLASGDTGTDVSKLGLLDSDFGTVKPLYSTFGYATVPIVVDQLPSSFTPWSPEDQYQMSKWNYYSNIYEVRAGGGSGNFSWPNGGFQLDGWQPNSVMQSVFGYTWGSTTLAITFYNFDSGSHIANADIAFNPAYSWTLDDAWIFSGTSSAWPFRGTMLHELGHMWGLNHNFYALSIMNYSPQVYRAYAIPFMDDAQAIRANYSGQVQGRSDEAAYLFYANGYQNFTEASYPTEITAGNTLGITNFEIENTGTTNLSDTPVEWYLTTSLNYTDPYYYLGTTSYGALNTFTYFTPSTLAAYLTVPSTVPGGTYYINGYVPSDDGGINFPFDNNHAWSYYKVQVDPSLNSVYGSPSSISENTSTTGYAVLNSNAGPGNTYVYLHSDNSVVSVPDYTAVTPGTYYNTFTISAGYTAAPTTATITGTANGTSQSSTITVTVPTTQTVSNVTAEVGKPLTYTATLTRNSDGSPLSGYTVNFYFNNVYYTNAITDSNGKATINVPTTTGKTIAIESYFYAVNGYEFSSAIGKASITPTASTLTGTGASGAYGATVSLKAKLIRTSNSLLLNGKKITYAIGGTTLGSATTASGIATLSYKISDSFTVGAHTVSIKFAGDGSNKASAGSLTLTIVKTATFIQLPGLSGKKGSTVSLHCTLKRHGDDAALSGYTISFKLGTKTVGTAVTNASGLASLSYKIPTTAKAGAVTITGTFAGTVQYSASSATSALTIK